MYVMYIYIYMCVCICVCIHVYEIDRFRSSHPGVFLKVGAPKMCGKSWKDIYEELHFSQCFKHATWRKQPPSPTFSRIVLMILCYL